MAVWLKYAIIALVGYLLGNISVGILISRLYGIRDIRKVGSGNAGTTNVLRNLGWVPSVLTLVGDCLKGLFAALIGKWIAGDVGLIIGGTFAVRGNRYSCVCCDLIYSITQRGVECVVYPVCTCIKPLGSQVNELLVV